MNALTAARRSLAEALEDLPGVDVHDHVPNKLVAPAVLMAAAEPYLTKDEGNTFAAGDLTTGLELYLLAKAGRNETVQDAMDELLAAVWRLLPSGWEWVEASALYMAEINSSTYPTCRVRLARVIDLHTESE